MHMANKETTDKFVQDMLKRAGEKEEPKPQLRTDGVDAAQVEKITENIRERIQKRRQQF